MAVIEIRDIKEHPDQATLPEGGAALLYAPDPRSNAPAELCTRWLAVLPLPRKKPGAAEPRLVAWRAEIAAEMRDAAPIRRFRRLNSLRQEAQQKVREAETQLAALLAKRRELIGDPPTDFAARLAALPIPETSAALEHAKQNLDALSGDQVNAAKRDADMAIQAGIASITRRADKELGDEQRLLLDRLANLPGAAELLTGLQLTIQCADALRMRQLEQGVEQALLANEEPPQAASPGPERSTGKRPGKVSAGQAAVA